MSGHAMHAVFELRVGNHASKLVLLAMADYAGEEGLCYQTIETLVRRTELNRKTVMRSIKYLAEAGMMIDTGEKTGRTNRVTIWKLLFLDASKESKNMYLNGNSPKLGNNPKLGTSNSPKLGTSNSPKIGTQNKEWNIEGNKDKRFAVSEKGQKVNGNPPGNAISVATKVLDFLNRKTGRSFAALNPKGQPTVHAKLVMELLRRGYTEQDIRGVIAKKYRDWNAPEVADKMSPYVRPSTLFRPSNFETYHGELPNDLSGM